ncbi:class I SAM-dependent methyltransferase [Erythrobacter sp. SDW2]|uniref:class I SAM-dependent methyltransferase n=1 Tax=Erythrobacter sp. SDW2 TaxID=2907154 RepID=UPI001F1A8F40|nr:class I SAM-dependent methyltransferase [Erythrobacter sp. SDW2]UIP06440.1 class I SAM-dependent methyltransferase [Erythrobacter sp. SDW2]
MTSREKTGFLPRMAEDADRPLGDRLFTIAWGAIQWPWLARSLWGGRLADKQALLDHLELPYDALPNLGSWKADTWFLWQIVEAVERLRPEHVVELGCGASSLVLARALQRSGGGELTSYDQHADFVVQTGEWLASHGLGATMRHAPIVPGPNRWSYSWYDLSGVPAEIDLLVIDGPPWALGPFGRGNAERLFSRIRPGGMVLLDDGARPGERVVASRWRRDWPDFDWRFAQGAKGTLIGERRG